TAQVSSAAIVETRTDRPTGSAVGRIQRILYESIRLLLALVDDLVCRLLLDKKKSRIWRARARFTTLRSRTARPNARPALALRVERLSRFAEGAIQLLLRGANLGHVVAAKRLACTLDRGVELGLELGRELVRPLLRVLLDLVGHAVESIARVDLLAPRLVGRRILFGVLHHLVDVRVREAARRLDADLLLLVRGLVLGRHVENAVRIDVERDLDLRHAARSGRNARELELADRAIVARQLALALQHVNLDRRLIVVGRRERFRLLGRDGRVARDEHRRDAAQRLDPKGKRRDIEQQHVFLLAGEHRALNRRTDRHDLVWVHRTIRFLAEVVFDDLLNLRDARRAADENDLIDLVRLETGVFERLFHRLERALDEVVDQLLELGASERIVEVLGPALIGGDERQVDVRRHRARQLHLRLLGGLLQALERHRILREVDALIALELADDPVDHALVEVVAAQVRVAVGRLDLELPRAFDVVELEHADVVGAAAQVEHGDLLILLLVEAIGECGGCGLVDDAEHVEAGDLAGVLGGLALRVVEVGRNGDDRLRHRIPEVVFRRLLHLLEDHRRDFGRRVALALDLDRGDVIGTGDDLVRDALDLVLHFAHPAAHEPLDRKDRVLWIGNGLALGDLTDEPFTVFGETDDRRGRATALGVGDHDGIAAFHDCDDGVRRPEI